MRRWGAALALATAACHPRPCPRAGEAAPPIDAAVEEAAPAVDALSLDARVGVDLEWRVRRAGATLRVDYDVYNATDRAIYLLDQPIVDGAVDPDALVVVAGDAPGLVILARAAIPTRAATASAYEASVRRVEPHGTAAGTAHAPWPLRAWNAGAAVDPLAGAATSAYLVVGYVEDRGEHTLDTVQLAAGPVDVPRRRDRARELVGRELALPR